MIVGNKSALAFLLLMIAFVPAGAQNQTPANVPPPLPEALKDIPEALKGLAAELGRPQLPVAITQYIHFSDGRFQGYIVLIYKSSAPSSASLLRVDNNARVMWSYNGIGLTHIEVVGARIFGTASDGRRVEFDLQTGKLLTPAEAR